MIKLIIRVVSYVIIANLAYNNILLSQTTGCGHDHMQQQLEQRNPSIQQLQRVFERKWRQQMLPRSRQLYTIPVVVHLVHNNGPENISDQQVQQAIQAINDGMRNRAPFNPQTGVDVEIELCLAVRDPQGSATSGITRTQSPLTQLIMEPEDTLLKDLIRWDPSQYLNIWVVNSITSQASGPGVAGYAYFPSSHGQREDGIVGEFTYFNARQEDISVFIHEMGHYLGLYHTFEGGCRNNDCLANGDKVCDTPPDGSTSVFPCNASPNTCSTDEDDSSLNNPFRAVALGGLGDQPDMINNYMDYGDPACTDAFTTGQKNRMVLALTNERPSLLVSQGCTSPCSQPVIAAISKTNLPVSVGKALQLQFSGSGPVTQYEWQVNGQAFSTNANASYTFPQAGTYIFRLKVSGQTTNCWDIVSDTLEVFCEPRASFTGWQDFLLPGDVMQLTANGPATSTYTWLVNGAVAGNGQTFNYSSQQATSIIIRLEADHGLCKDTSEARITKVGSCGQDEWMERNNWAVEDSMLFDFSNTSALPVVTKGSVLRGHWTPSPYYWGTFLEASVTMSDDQGNLLFYSNGEKIWDRNNQVMPNGWGILGHYSTSQGCLAFPDPADPDLYYLFTLDALENNGRNGLRYTKIDMRLRGGLGDVVSTEKNVLVAVTNYEWLGGVYHANNKDVWVVVGSRPTSSWNAGIDAYLVTNTGLQTTPVSTLNIINGSNVQPGPMTFSHDGNLLFSGLNLYHFNRNTGIPSFFMNFHNRTFFMRSAEFSPDQNKVYFTGSNSNTGDDEIYQFDVSSGVPATIMTTQTTLHTHSLTSWFQSAKIEIGRDKRLYIKNNGTQYMCVIHQPDQAGLACDFRHNELDFTRINSYSRVSLPSYVRGKSTSSPFVLEASNLKPCPGAEVSIWPVDPKGIYEISYKLLGPAGSDRKNGDTLIVVPSQQGTLGIASEFRNPCGIQHDTVWLQVKAGPFFDLGPDITLCQSPVRLTAPAFPDITYLWSDGSISSTLDIHQPGIYWLEEVNYFNGCGFRDSIEVLPAPPAVAPDLGPDQSICSGGVLELFLTDSYSSIRWWDGSKEPKVTISQAGKYWVTVVDICGNILSDTIEIEALPSLPRQVPDSVFFCHNQSVSIDMQSPGYTRYHWHDGPLLGIRTFDEEGTFYLSAWDARGCLQVDSLVVRAYEEYPSVSLPPEMIICEGQTYELDVSSPGWVHYSWSDGESGPARSFSEDGTYLLRVEDRNGCVEEASIDIQMSEGIPLVFSPPPPICIGDTISIDVSTPGFSRYQWENGLLSSSRELSEQGTYTVKALDLNGCETQASVELITESCSRSQAMPSAFTPNGDGHNEYFGVIPQDGSSNYELTIFNRWGAVVYLNTNPTPGWDGRYNGRSCPEGVYVYLLKYHDSRGLVHRQRGSITLIR